MFLKTFFLKLHIRWLVTPQGNTYFIAKARDLGVEVPQQVGSSVEEQKGILYQLQPYLPRGHEWITRDINGFDISNSSKKNILPWQVDISDG